MGKDQSIKYLLTISNTKGVKSFVSDEVGIEILKLSFQRDAKKYLYLRKGEAEGSLLVSLADLIKDAATIIFIYTKLNDFAKWVKTNFPKARDYVIKNYPKDKGKIKAAENIRLLCTDDKNAEGRKAAPYLTEQGQEVRFYKDKKQSGSHRFFLSDKEFAFFIRIPGGKFFGFTGKDENIRKQLKEMFEKEWKEAIPYKGKK